MLTTTVLAAFLLAAAPSPAPAAADGAVLQKLLDDFLAGAGRNDAAMHDRFWADDLVYTGSGGRRVGKADIMKDVRGAPAPKPDDPTAVYSAEDVRITQYGDTAVVAFRLVATTKEKNGNTDASRYLNTGTFVKRAGEWRAVAWQATKMPPPQSEAGPFAVEYYYKAKWGHFDEFFRLFKKNHLPVLMREKSMGRIVSVDAEAPRYHATEDGRWDLRITIVWKDAATAHDAFDSSVIKKELFPDQKTYEQEEQRRFEILDAHWDVPVETKALDK